MEERTAGVAGSGVSRAASVVFADGERHRVHSSYVWLKPLALTVGIIAIAVLNCLDEVVKVACEVGEGGFDSWWMVVAGGVAGVVVLFGILVGMYVLAYKRLYFVFDSKEFSVHSGVFVKRHQHVPYARVQSVNHTASFIQRLVGVCTVKIETAGGAANKAVSVPYVTLSDAEAIRTDLFVRKTLASAGEQARVMVRDSDRGAVPVAPRASDGPFDVDQTVGSAGDAARSWRGVVAGARTEDVPIRYHADLSAKELLLTGISHTSGSFMRTFAGVFTLVAVGVGVASALASESFLNEEVPIVYAAGVVAAVTLAVLVVSWVSGVVANLVSFGGFRVARRGNRIEVEHGLLQHEFSGIDVDRVQSVVVAQSFVRRLLGYCEVSLGRVDSLGSDSGGNEAKLSNHGLVVHPFVKLDQVDGLLEQLLPEFADMPRRTQLEPLPSVALRRALLRRCLWTNAAFYIVLCAVGLQVALGLFGGGAVAIDDRIVLDQGQTSVAFAVVYVLCALCMVTRAVGAVLWHRGSGSAWSRSYACLYNDGLSTELVCVPRQKIQYGRTFANPFQSRSHVAGIAFSTAAGVGKTETALWDVEEQRAREWLEWVKPRGKAVSPAGNSSASRDSQLQNA